ncbi:hypothetical protein MA16_Dca012875 [Dendrobium catenatum]|uniref:Uncharacterized protein n=1 Tax=Dendrobium catenatum TaxID=906689 RepID=A0A2I0VXS1_9ASPA|nr:hypothetical protein MA16_Dca012875 [Dendrobium catenatum]
MVPPSKFRKLEKANGTWSPAKYVSADPNIYFLLIVHVSPATLDRTLTYVRKIRLPALLDRSSTPTSSMRKTGFAHVVEAWSSGA